jgi:hypothetical protein
MARTPSPLDVPTVGASVQRQARADGSDFGADMWGAAQQVAGQAKRELDDLADTRRAATEQAFDAEATTAFSLRAQEVLQEEQDNAQPGAAGLAQRVQTRLAQERDRILKEMRGKYPISDTAFTRANARALSLSTLTLKDAGRYEHQEQVREAVTSADRALQSQVLAVARNPAAFDTQLALFRGNVNGFDIPPKERAEFLKKGEAQLQEGRVRGLIERDPHGTVRRLSSGEFDDSGIGATRLLALGDAAEREARRRDVAAEKAETQANARALSDLEIRVSRGEADVADVEAAYDGGAGWLKPNQRTELVKAADRVAGKVVEREAAKARVGAAVEGMGTLDPREKADRDAVDDYFVETVVPAIQALPEERAGDAVEMVTNFVDKAGIIPSVIKSDIRGGLRSTDAQKRVQAADTLDRLVTRNPALGQDFAQEDVALGTAIMANMRAGVEPQRAIELAETKVLKAGEPEAKKRREFLSLNAKKVREGNARELERQLGGSVLGNLGLAGTPTASTGEMAGAYDRLVEQHYQVQGDIDIARKAALQELRQVWGVTEIGPRRWMPYAPERVYQVPGAPDGWHREQLLTDLKAGGMFDEAKGDLEDRVVIAATPETGRMARPAYSVLLKNENGELIPLRKPDGSMMLWRPDWAASPAAKRMEAEAEKAKREAEAKRQRVRGEKEKNLDQIQRMQESGMFGRGEAVQ